MNKYKLNLETDIIIKAKNLDDAKEKSYVILEALMNTLIVNKEIKDTVVKSDWTRTEPLPNDKAKIEVEHGSVSFAEFYGKENITHMYMELDTFFKNKKGGFIIFVNEENEVIHDAYMGVCARHVLRLVKEMVKDAVKVKMIEKSC